MNTARIVRYLPQRRHRDINKTAAKRNLFDFCDLLQSADIPHFLAFGTLLGAVREEDFIEHDTDVDIATTVEHRSAFKRLSESDALAASGFEVGRDMSELFSVIRDEELIDLYFFTPGFPEYKCLNYRIRAEQLQNGFSQIEFLGRRFNTVKCPEEDLRWRYGDDWRQSKKGFHAPR